MYGPKEPGNSWEDLEAYAKNLESAGKQTFKMSSTTVKQDLTNPGWSIECSKAVALRRRARNRMIRHGSRENKREFRRLLAYTIRLEQETSREGFRKYTSKITHKTVCRQSVSGQSVSAVFRGWHWVSGHSVSGSDHMIPVLVYVRSSSWLAPMILLRL